MGAHLVSLLSWPRASMGLLEPSLPRAVSYRLWVLYTFTGSSMAPAHASPAIQLGFPRVFFSVSESENTTEPSLICSCSHDLIETLGRGLLCCQSLLRPPIWRRAGNRCCWGSDHLTSKQMKDLNAILPFRTFIPYLHDWEEIYLKLIFLMMGIQSIRKVQSTNKWKEH